MYKKIIISKEEFKLKIPKELQGKAIEIYIFPAEKEKGELSKKIDFGYG